MDVHIYEVLICGAYAVCNPSISPATPVLVKREKEKERGLRCSERDYTYYYAGGGGGRKIKSS
jgi:hypothetical protein